MTSQAPAVTGCDALRFSPEAFSVQPDTAIADNPTGLTFDLRVPQSETPETLATPPLRDASVVLPAGMTINPSAASGLAACSEAQIGWKGGSVTNFTAAAPECSEASKIGSVEVSTPLVGGVLPGTIYLAAQNENPFHSLLAGYIVIDDPVTGTVVKIAGELKTDPVTGQVTGVFDENPQLPFSELKLRFFGGSRGPLATPQSCGVFTTTSDFMPWSAPQSGPDATPSSSFPISSKCTDGFAPSLSAGTLSGQAGAFSPLTVTIARQDGEQHLAGVSLRTPPGLLASLKGISLCPGPQASQGECPAGTQIGETTVAAGVGPNPYSVRGGRVYLTGPYNGGPFGLSIVVPAVAGPFDLGKVVVRSSIRVDPHTGQITVLSDPLPQMIDSEEGLRSGIPADIRIINVTINRPGFTFNPTNCSPLSVSATINGAQGATANVSSPFRAVNCASLAFHPSFKVSTQAKTSKKNGASLDVKVASGAGQANIGKVAVSLSKQLPSRLTTIQQACPEATFNQNPASCPAGSNIGMATAKTPVLSNPLVGPAYLVSHGGAAFPDLVVILQGEGVTLDLIGSIDIKKGVTSSTFAGVPDAPISTFELKLPEGPHSGLAAVLPAKAKGNLCGTTLTMPTTLTGQNGAQIKQNTKIAVTGCPKAKKKTKTKHKKTKKIKKTGH
jgi:hypothetical protein